MRGEGRAGREGREDERIRLGREGRGEERREGKGPRIH
jgi:hypothetical protein